MILNQPQETENDLPEFGFIQPKQKRGIFKWILGLSVILNVWLMHSKDAALKECNDKHEQVLKEIIDMQNRTEHKVDTVIRKI